MLETTALIVPMHLAALIFDGFNVSTTIPTPSFRTPTSGHSASS